MDANTSSSERDPLERLAAEYLDRRRGGEHVSPSEYAEKHPRLAEQILEFFPALEVMEGLKPGSGDQTDSFGGQAEAAGTPRLERLGEYRVIREIGHGGMGVVYEAIQESLGRQVALKILPFHGRVDPVQIERFRLESRSAARLHHGNIVPVYGMGEYEGVYYYAMQYIAGHGLDVILDDLRRLRAGVNRPAAPAAGSGETRSMVVARSLLTGRFAGSQPGRDPGPPTTASPGEAGGTRDVATVPASSDSGISSVLSSPTESGYYRASARLSIQVAQALAHAHQQGVLHRDIKPSNLLLDGAGHVWVTDFGLAKVEGAEGPTQTGDIVGTLRYMAPERFEGWSDRRSDIYGLGMTLYELLTLSHAFEAATRARLIDQVIHDQPAAPRKHDPRVPRDLETIVLKAIAKEPGERYATVEALAMDLENYLADRPIVARRSRPLERVWRWCRRNKAAAGLLAAIAVAALALVGVGVGLLDNAQVRESERAAVTARQAAVEARNAEAEQRKKAEAAYLEGDRQRGIAEVALKNERMFLYTNRVIFAHRELSDHNPFRAEELLEECPRDQRGWEWNYLKRQCRTELLALNGDESEFPSVAFTLDGKQIVSAGGRVVRFWDGTTGRPLHTWDGYSSEVSGLAISPDGSRLATSSGTLNDPEPVLVRDLKSGKILLHLDDAKTGVHSGVAFSSDNRLLAIDGGDLSGGHSYFQIRDASTGKMIRTIPTDQPAYTPSFSRDGRRVLGVVGGQTNDSVNEKNRVVVWDVKTGIEQYRLTDHRASLMVATCSPDGKMIVSAGYDSIVRLYDASSYQLRRELSGHQNCVNRVAFSTDGRWLASASDDNTIILWDVTTGQSRFTFSGHRGGIFAVAFHPDGGRVVTGGYDGQIKLWDARSSRDSKILLPPVPSAGVFSLAFNHRGDVLASACADDTVKLWEMPTGRLKATLTGHHQPVWRVAFSPDDRWIASAAGDWSNPGQAGEIHLWDARTGRLVRPLLAHRGIARTVAFSPDGSQLASGGGEYSTHDDRIMIWDVASGRELRSIPFPDGGIRSVAFSPGGHEVAAVAGKLARTWDIETGRPLISFAGHQGKMSYVAYRAGGGRLVTAAGDRTIRIWDAATGQELRRLLGHHFMVMCFALSPDDRRIASVGGDMRLKIWDAENGQELLTIRGHDSDVPAVAFSPDGNTVVTGDQQGIIKIWDGRPVSGEAP